MSKNNAPIKYILSKSRKQLFPLALICVGNIAASALSVYQALLMRTLIDSATGDGRSWEALISTAVMLGAALVVLFALRIADSYFSTRIQSKLEIAFKSALVNSIIRKDYAKITSYHTGELLNRIVNDVSVVSDAVVTIPTQLCGLSARLALAFSALAVLDIKFALIVACAGLLLFTVSRIARKPLKRLHKSMQEADGKLRSFLQEILSNILAVKAYFAYDKINAASQELQDAHYRQKMKRRAVAILANTGFSFAFMFGFIFALVWSSVNLYNGVITFGTLTAIMQLVNQVQSPFTGISGLLPKYYAMLASAERICEIDALPDEASTAQMRDAAALYSELDVIRFRNVGFSYDERSALLSNVSFDIARGDFIAIAGISGIGKSTLMKLLLGVYTPSEGSIEIISRGGSIITADSSTRRLFSYVPQSNLLLSGTIRDCLTFFIDEEVSDESIIEALKISCAYDFVSSLADGLDTVIGEHGLGLSEGQAQRLSVARAVLSGAPILLLDEATSALDEDTERRLLSNIRAMKDKSCIIITHRPAGIEMCDKVARIENSTVVMTDNEQPLL